MQNEISYLPKKVVLLDYFHRKNLDSNSIFSNTIKIKSCFFFFFPYKKTQTTLQKFKKTQLTIFIVSHEPLLTNKLMNIYRNPP